MVLETVEIELGKIKPNPFKKHINDGKLNKSVLEKLEEGYKQTTFHENLLARRNDKEELELVYGHHRLQVAKKVYGNNHRIKIGIVDFSDEQMLVDMVRENLTHRDTDFRDVEDSVLLARAWKHGKCQRAEQLGTLIKRLNAVKGKKGFQKTNGSSYDVAKFLAKQGKAISPDLVQRYLSIHDNLSQEIHDKIEKLKGSEKTRDNAIGVELAFSLSKLEEKHQKPILEKIKKQGGNFRHELREALTHFKNSDDETKEAVLKGEVLLTKIKEYKSDKNFFDDYDQKEPSWIEKASGLKKAFDVAQNNWQKVLIHLADKKTIKDLKFRVTDVKGIIKDINDTQKVESDAIENLKRFLK